jgi:hypothetical protein
LLVSEGLRLVVQSTLMTIGLYNEPTGAYLPSGIFLILIAATITMSEMGA